MNHHVLAVNETLHDVVSHLNQGSSLFHFSISLFQFKSHGYYIRNEFVIEYIAMMIVIICIENWFDSVVVTGYEEEEDLNEIMVTRK